MTLTRAPGLLLWALAILVPALLAAAAWPVVASRVLHRDITFTLTIEGPGPAAFWWSDSSRPNGFWIDPDDSFTKSTSPRPGVRAVDIRHGVPSDGIDFPPATCNAGTTVSATDAVVRTFFRGRVVKSRALTACPAWADVLFSPSLPAIHADYPRGRWYAALGGAFAGLIAGLTFIGIRWVEQLRAEREAALTTSMPRWLTPATIAVCFAIPISMSLWAPMFFIADSTAYIWIAHLFQKTGSMDHFDGWRLPGYAAILLPFMSLFKDFAVPIGILQALLGGLTALFVLDMLRPRLRAPWPHLAALLVSIDPVLLAWQRVVMCETASAFFITLAAWIFVKAADKPDDRTRRALAAGAGLGCALGLACGCACLIRGNNLVLPAVLLAALLFIAIVQRSRRSLVSILPCAAVTFLCLLPLFILNQKHFDRFTMTVGRHFTRSLFSWENGTTDWNQCGTLSFKEFKDLRAKLRAGSMTDWEVMGWLKYTTTVRVPAGAHDTMMLDTRCRVFVDEALARKGPEFFAAQWHSAAGLLGFPVTEPAYALNGTWAVFAQLCGRPNPRTPTNFDFPLSLFPADLQNAMTPAIHDVSWTQQSAPARVFGAWFDAWRWPRAVLGSLYLVALLRLIVTGRWAFAAIGAVALANMIGVPVLTYAAEYRYAAPFYPLVAITLFYGVFVPGRTLKKQGQSNP